MISRAVCREGGGADERRALTIDKKSDAGAPYSLPTANPSEEKIATAAARDAMEKDEHVRRLRAAVGLEVDVGVVARYDALNLAQSRLGQHREAAKSATPPRLRGRTVLTQPDLRQVQRVVSGGHPHIHLEAQSRPQPADSLVLFPALPARSRRRHPDLARLRDWKRKTVGGTHIVARVDREGSRRSPPARSRSSWPPPDAAPDPLPSPLRQR